MFNTIITQYGNKSIMKYPKSKTSHYKLSIKLFMLKMNDLKKDELSAETFSTPRTLYIQLFFFFFQS